MLAELQKPSTLRAICRNLLYEPNPEAAKRRLLEPMMPRPILFRLANAGYKAVLVEFDPLLGPRPKLGVNRRELPSLTTTENIASQPQLALHKETVIFNVYRTIFPKGRRLEVDTLAFLDAMTPDISEVRERSGYDRVASCSRRFSPQSLSCRHHLWFKCMRMMSSFTLKQQEESSSRRLSVALDLGNAKQNPFRERLYFPASKHRPRIQAVENTNIAA